uniref:Uncharacterized protein n=1 Tax=Arundo donax TaxID=35708 RepID=A0A0A9ASM1_ARUDO
MLYTPWLCVSIPNRAEISHSVSSWQQVLNLPF